MSAHTTPHSELQYLTHTWQKRNPVLTNESLRITKANCAALTQTGAWPTRTTNRSPPQEPENPMMKNALQLTADDGHILSAYRADPDSTPRGGVVVLQEIFGVNQHIRAVCDRLAADGFVAIAPALYDRSSVQNCQLDYDATGVDIGRKLRSEFSWDDTVKDVAAAAGVLHQEGLKVATVGFCWGGSISFLAATRLNLSAAVVYYGAQIMPYINEAANTPLLMHFGQHDASIPPKDVAAIRIAYPTAEIHVYPAGHGFNCDLRQDYDAESSAIAYERTLRFFTERLQ